MKLVMTRGLTIETSATACALANAASVAFLSPTGTSNSTLPGWLGQTCGACCCNVDGEFRMRVRRTQHQRMQRGLRRVIVGVAATAADQCVVFLAKDALTDAEFDGSSHLVSNCSFYLCLRMIFRKTGTHF